MRCENWEDVLLRHQLSHLTGEPRPVPGICQSIGRGMSRNDNTSRDPPHQYRPTRQPAILRGEKVYEKEAADVGRVMNRTG